MGDERSPLFDSIQANRLDWLMLAVDDGNDVNGYFESGGYRFYPLYKACEKYRNYEKSDTRILEYLISRGANLDSVNGFSGLTALHLAVQYGHIYDVAVLLEAGASIDIRGRDGRNIVEFAEFHGKHEIVAFIESYCGGFVKGCYDG